MNTVLILKLASLSYLGLLTAGILMPGVVGLRQHLLALPTFVRQALAGEPITVFGPGTQTRCFSHVRDVVKAVARLLDEPAAVLHWRLVALAPDEGYAGALVTEGAARLTCWRWPPA